MTTASDDGYIRNNFPRPFLRPGDELSEGEARNVQTIVRVMQEFWCEGRRDVAAELFEEGSIRHDPLVPDVVGPEAYSDLVAEYHDSWKMNEFILQIIMAEQNWIAWRLLVKCTQIAPFYGIPNSGCDVDVLTHTFVIHNEKGQAREGWILTDYSTVVWKMLSSLKWWQLIAAAPSMLGTMKKKWLAMRDSGHKPKARSGHDKLELAEDGYIRDAFPRPYLAAEKPTEDEIKNIGVVIRANKEYWFEGRTEIGPEIFAEGGIRHEATVPDQGFEAYAEYVKYYHTAFKFKDFDIQVVMAEGDFVAFRTVTSAVHVGKFYGCPPTGAEIAVVTHAYCRFNKDHKIIEGWVVTDYLTVFMDLVFGMPWYKRYFYVPLILRNIKKQMDMMHHESNRQLAPRVTPPPSQAAA